MKPLLRLILLILIASLPVANVFAGGVIVKTDSTQGDFLKAYKLAMYESYVDYRFTSSNIDTAMFPKWGEESIYWVRSGPDKGAFVIPSAPHSSYSAVDREEYDTYDWEGEYHYSFQYKPSSKRVAIFKSSILHNNKTVNWQALYFRNIFHSYLYGNIYYYLNEAELDTNRINGATQLLIIPSFTAYDGDHKYYIDSVFAATENLRTRIDKFLENGGTIYAEGNAAYFIEKLGFLDSAAVDFDDNIDPDPNTNLLDINYTNSDHPMSFTENAVGGEMFTATVPMVEASGAEVIVRADEDNRPVAFTIHGDDAEGGRIICNLGLTTTGGINEIGDGSRQLQWTLNALMSAFAGDLDVTRSIYNELPDTLTVGKNAIPYDRKDEFEVRILLRNLSDDDVENITIRERLRSRKIDGQWQPYLDFVKVKTPDMESEISGANLYLKDISLPARSEKEIVYIMETPDPEDDIHEHVDSYLSWRTYMYATIGYVDFDDQRGHHEFYKYRNYCDIMFSANIVADADLNWKNFLGLYYQPFKIFMIMENKERTNAENTRYTQYIPKDVPFYWSDKSINIPVLKTPGGKYVDVLRGSNDEDNPEYDMDSDGNPDAWLDTASIYPKGYTIEEDEVYWLNPWEHLRTGNEFYYEDIDHDGLRAQDTDGDGVVDIEEPGDKIRVWKITWDIGRVPGYDYHDPYCYLELWVDPPDLVKLSAGVSEAHEMLDEDVSGMFYPYTGDIGDADLNDTTWTHWMERDEDGDIIWKQFVRQSTRSYEGFAFVDTSEYRLRPGDEVMGTVPQPHREFIAVLSLGGEEIDMRNPTPQQSLYSKMEYNTIFNEHRTTPMRTTYTYYAPLPNPLQFEYLTNNYTITDPDGKELRYLPENGMANITFDVDASTEYSYYWIRNAGHDIDYGDPSEEIEGVEELGDGVFGYMIYDIPKGIGGYRITLPKKENGEYDTDAIVKVDGKPFSKLLDNPNTGNEVEIWEDNYQYHVYIPQLLIPPALDDDNFDGVDDWIDDRGDRFQSNTGYLHDGFMLDNGEDWPDYPEEPFKDDIYGWVESGWYHGEDETYGDDFFENLGKRHFQISCIYEGLGREGPIEISKGAWLVVEEIFGGSPWVIFSHTLSGFAKGLDLNVSSEAVPSMVKFGLDTMYVKHEIEDKNEPHEFNKNFDPYHVSYGFGEATITTYAGGRDPCSLISPPINMSTIVDPDFDHKEITLVPMADGENPDLEDYPKNVKGSFIEVKIEIHNGTDDNWINTKIEPVFGTDVGKTKVAMSYVAYPRPLVPAKVDPKTGEIIQGGDDLGTFSAGWRFNQPEGEVLVKMGNTLPLMQPSRKAYFVILLSIDESLENGVYQIDFEIDGNKKHYDGENNSPLNYEVPPLWFAISDRDSKGNVEEYQKMVIGQAKLQSLKINTSDNFSGLEDVRWSTDDVNDSDFEDMDNTLSSQYSSADDEETIDLSGFDKFPRADNTRIFIMQKGEINSVNAGDVVEVAEGVEMKYKPDDISASTGKKDKLQTADYATVSYDRAINVDAVGPKIKIFKRIYSVNGVEFTSEEELYLNGNTDRDIGVVLEISNSGTDMSEKTSLRIYPGEYFDPIESSLPDGCSLEGRIAEMNLGGFIPGEMKRVRIHYQPNAEACETKYDKTSVIPAIDVTYQRADDKETFYYPDETILDFPATDFNMLGIKSLQAKITLGSVTRIVAEFENGVKPAENVDIGFYAIIDRSDTVGIARENIAELIESEKDNIMVNFEIPEKAEMLELMARIDPDSEHCEFCENNNSVIVDVPIYGPDWVTEVTAGPNPFDSYVNIEYTLTREMRHVDMLILDMDGREIDRIADCPTGYGRRSVRWNAAECARGGYIYQIKGIDRDGETEQYFGKIIKK